MVLNGDDQLPESIRKIVADTSNKCFLSIASLWEIAIKSSLNKLELQGNFSQIGDFLIANDIEIMPITFEHIQRLVNLSFHHRDPFDRIIIAQAFIENLTVATKDKAFFEYGVNIVWK
jgi:PIN domain nuclease of toxin-antitoxin system